MTAPIKPRVDEHGVPLCDDEACPHYDGKRCSVMGFRPDGICEPAVLDIAAEVAAWRAWWNDDDDPLHGDHVAPSVARTDAWRPK